MLSFAKHFRLVALPLLGAVVLLLSSCAENERFVYPTEGDEPNYREGVSLLKTGRKQEALAAFLKVIDRRGNDAADSHLEVGLLYQQHINDPLSAIYHFKKFLSLRPNSPQASLVRQRIDAATRDFARTLPAQPLESQLQRVDLVAALDVLRQENASLKQELADLRSRRDVASVATQNALPEPVPVAASSRQVEAAPAPAADDYSFSLSSLPTARTRRSTEANATRQPAPQVSTPTRPSPQTQTPVAKQQTPAVKQAAPTTQQSSQPATAARRHIVRPGETLMQISQNYYGNRSRWREIFAANRNVMRSETDLKPGMALRIP